MAVVVLGVPSSSYVEHQEAHRSSSKCGAVYRVLVAEPVRITHYQRD